VKLLLDANISQRLVPFLDDTFPGTSHVALVQLERASDQLIWDYAKSHDFVIVTKDADFEELSVLYGAPPHVVWLRGGGELTSLETLRLLNEHADFIREKIVAGIACVEIVKPRA
jgi:predicted nuclease of predicted toxin-antitoxin system